MQNFQFLNDAGCARPRRPLRSLRWGGRARRRRPGCADCICRKVQTLPCHRASGGIESKGSIFKDSMRSSGAANNKRPNGDGAGEFRVPVDQKDGVEALEVHVHFANPGDDLVARGGLADVDEIGIHHSAGRIFVKFQKLAHFARFLAGHLAQNVARPFRGHVRDHVGQPGRGPSLRECRRLSAGASVSTICVVRRLSNSARASAAVSSSSEAMMDWRSSGDRSSMMSARSAGCMRSSFWCVMRSFTRRKGSGSIRLTNSQGMTRVGSLVVRPAHQTG